MDLGIKGKRALVTGASTGLGYHAALELARNGVELVINSRSDQRLAKAAQQITDETGITPKTVAGDISQPEIISRVIDAALPVDILVSNAGGPPPGRFDALDESQFEDAYNIVLQSAVRLTRGVLPRMLERKWGRLIYITSIAVRQPENDLLLSNTFRAGLTGFIKSISNTHAAEGITANSVLPGYTLTDRLIELADKRAGAAGKTRDEVLEQFAANVPAGRLGRPDELAALIVFLASQRAAYITGQAILCDGGAAKSLL